MYVHAMDPGLQSFVRDALLRGLPRGAIREQLHAAGWRAEDTEAALSAWAETDFPVPVPRRRPYLSARETFLYLLMFLALYVSAINLGGLVFQVIDRAFPDPLRTNAWDGFRLGQVRQHVAALIITFPLFLLVARALGRAMARDPEKRGSKVRKWLTYVTLFGAAGTLIGDLIALVVAILGGQLARAFLLKVATVFVIAGAAFWYYLAGLRQEEGEETAGARAQPGVQLARRAVAWASAALVLASVVVALGMLGSPGTERRRALDRIRVQHLSELATRVDDYYTRKQRLPGDIGELTGVAALRRGAPPAGPLLDPETGRPYTYSIVDSTHYRLCAVFLAQARLDPEATGPMVDTTFAPSRHGAGPGCFTLEVRGR
ncbi:MAG: hypothetical protein HZB25_06085 [Candidatus Eisenbacteria bacterium]|nr:hypothetical protein [Candidatus Eisenbacteria bacterium]